MTVTLPKHVLDKLPAADSEGLIRVKAAIKLMPDGKVSVLELNDSPVGSDDDNPMPSEDLPDLNQVEEDIYKP